MSLFFILPSLRGVLRLLRGLAITFTLTTFLVSTAQASCGGPLGEAGDMIYNADYKVMQYCNGTDWIGMGGGGSSLPGCSEGDTLVYAGGAWVCLPQMPDAFSFTDQTGVNVSTPVTSNAVTITGITHSVAVSVSGGGTPKIRINGSGGWVTSGTITNGQTLDVQLTSSSSHGATLSAVVTVGGSSDQWDVTTIPACSGVVVNGYCWHAGVNVGCDSVCSAYGGCNLAGLLYAGSGGTNPVCKTILDALSLGSGAVSTGLPGWSWGCTYNTAGYYPGRWRYNDSTSCAGGAAGTTRACACNY